MTGCSYSYINQSIFLSIYQSINESICTKAASSMLATSIDQRSRWIRKWHQPHHISRPHRTDWSSQKLTLLKQVLNRTEIGTTRSTAKTPPRPYLDWIDWERLGTCKLKVLLWDLRKAPAVVHVEREDLTFTQHHTTSPLCRPISLVSGYQKERQAVTWQI